MPYQPINPDDLDGEELDAWYRRSPDDIEQARQAAAQQGYDAFFNGAPDGSDEGNLTQAGAAPMWPSPTVTPASLDRSNYSVGDADLDLIGNPHNPRLRREWEQKEGQPWPATEDGRPYDVAHVKAIADGGTNTVDNIRPMHPEAHSAEHLNAGDFSRWGQRPGIARAFGGRVARALGVFAILPDITGVLSGRIRTNTFDNFSSDMMGQPSEEDQLRQFMREQKALDPNWKPGDAPLI